MAARTEVTIVNGHKYAVHIVGKRFRPGRPRTLLLTERQLNAIRGNPWLWIEGEDTVPDPDSDGLLAVSVGGGWYDLSDGSRVKGKDNLPEGATIVDELPAATEGDGDVSEDASDSGPGDPAGTGESDGDSDEDSDADPEGSEEDSEDSDEEAEEAD